MVDFGGMINGAQNMLGGLTGTAAWTDVYNDTKMEVYVGYATCTDWIQPWETKRVTLTAGTYCAFNFKGYDSDCKKYWYYNDCTGNTVKVSQLMREQLPVKPVRMRLMRKEIYAHDGGCSGIKIIEKSEKTCSDEKKLTSTVKGILTNGAATASAEISAVLTSSTETKETKEIILKGKKGEPQYVYRTYVQVELEHGECLTLKDPSTESKEKRIPPT